jgi:hypothetical protein
MGWQQDNAVGGEGGNGLGLTVRRQTISGFFSP